MSNSNDTMIASEFSNLVQNTISTVLLYKYLIFIIFVVAIGAGAYYASTLADKYTATSNVLIQDQQIQVMPNETSQTFKRDDLEIETQRELLTSSEISKKVIEGLNLSMSLQQYTDKFAVTGGVRSRMLNVTFEDESPTLAANIVNMHVDTYMNSEMKVRQEQIASIKQKAEQTIDELKSESSEKSQLAQDLRQNNNLIKGRGAEELIYEQISNISSQIPPIQAKKYALQSKLSALSRTNDYETVSDIVDSYLIQQLKVDESKRAQEYKLLQSELGESNPDLIAAREARDQATRAVQNEIENIKTSLKNELSELQRQESQLNARLRELGNRANVQQGKMIKLKELELEESATQQSLDSLLERNEQIQSQASFLQPKARVVSKAVAPEKPSGPNRALIIIGSVLFAFILNTLLVLLLELRKSGIKNFADIRKIYDREPLGIIPNMPKNASFLKILKRSRNKEAIKKIALKAILPHKNGAILITSAKPKEGRSMVASMFAHYLSMSGNNVILVSIDALGSAPPFRKLVSDNKGVHEILKGEGNVQDYVSEIEQNLFYLPSGESDFSSSEGLYSEKFSAFLEELKHQFDYVLLDAAPVLTHGEIETIASKTQGAIVVTEWLKTKPADLKNSIDSLQASSVNILGVVLNKVNIGRYKRLNPNADFLLPRK